MTDLELLIANPDATIVHPPNQAQAKALFERTIAWLPQWQARQLHLKIAADQQAKAESNRLAWWKIKDAGLLWELSAVMGMDPWRVYAAIIERVEYWAKVAKGREWKSTH